MKSQHVAIIALVTAIIVIKTLDHHINLGAFSTSKQQEWIVVDITLRGDHSQIHPFYNPSFFVPIGLSIPGKLLFNPAFHLISVFFLQGAVLLTFLLLCRYAGFSWVEAIIAALVTFDARSFLYLNVSSPNPFDLAQHFDYRSLTFPIAGLALFFLLKRRFIISGLTLGFLIELHLKFGIRFTCFLLIAALLWKYMVKISPAENRWNLSLSNLVQIILAIAAGSSYLLYRVYIGMNYFATLKAPRAEGLISPLGWLIKNEPDDWLIHYSGLLIHKWLAMLVASLVIWSILMKVTTDNKRMVLALVMMLASFFSGIFYLMGTVYEDWLIEILPISIAHSIMLLRFWDVMWVVPISFFVGLSALGFEVLKLIEIKKPKFSFDKGIILTIAVLFSIFLWHGPRHWHNRGFGTWAPKQDLKAYVDEPIYKVDYFQISDSVLCNSYRIAFEEAISGLKAMDRECLEQSISKMEKLYLQVFDKNKDKLEWANPDVWNLKALYSLKAGMFPEAITFLQNATVAQADTEILWKADKSINSLTVKKLKVELSRQDYLDITKYIAQNLPENSAIIQPPYLNDFNMLSKRFGFYNAGLETHVMYMLPSYYPLGLYRLYCVAGEYTLETNPGFTHGNVGIRGRDYFLNIGESALIKMHSEFPYYDYILTECTVQLSFTKLYQNSSFVLYKISK